MKPHKPTTVLAPDPASPAVAEPEPRVTVAEGMRFYEAIIGRMPTVDPEAPDLLPRLRDNEPPASNWRQELSRQVRDELARTLGWRLHVRFEGRPSWRELAETMTRLAGRHLDDARRRLNRDTRASIRPAAGGVRRKSLRLHGGPVRTAVGGEARNAA